MDDPLQEIIYRDQVRFSFAGEYQPLPDACPGVVEIAAIGLEDKKWRESSS